MKTAASNVRAHLVASMEMLTDESRTAEQIATDVERAKALSQLAREYTVNAKLELEAAKYVAEGRMHRDDMPVMLAGATPAALEHKR